MGSWFSSEEVRTEEKTVDSNGHVNNNIIIQEARDTHSQMIINEKLLFATYVLCLMEVIKLVLYCVGAYNKFIKKKYSGQNRN